MDTDNDKFILKNFGDASEKKLFLSNNIERRQNVRIVG